MRLLVATVCLFLLSGVSLAVPRSALVEQPAAWRRLSAFLIERIWGAPPESTRRAKDQLARFRANREVPGNFLARYGGDVVLRFNVTTDHDARLFAEAADVLFLDVWGFTDNWVDVRLSKDVLPSLLGLLPDGMQSAYTSLLDERALLRAIADTYPFPSTAAPSTLPGAGHSTFSPSLSTSARQSDTNIFFTDYQPMSVIIPWMRLLASMFSTHVRLISVGKSYEGRDIPAFRVGNHPTNDDEPQKPRKTILVMGGSHAREWISVTSVTYLAYYFITQYGKTQPATSLLEAFDIVMIPTINPDGYVYSWDTDRLWRKNRQNTPLRFCNGVDLDRSWGFKWDGNATRENPCSESYAGDAPFQGIEAAQLQAWAKNETENGNVDFVAVLDLHSYSQQVLYPYSFSCDALPPSLEDLEELAMGLAKALRMPGGHYYQATSACEGNVATTSQISSKSRRRILPRLETGGGSAIDWFLHEMRVKYAFQIKLRDTGSYGFLLPKENIIPNGKEIVEAMMYLGRYMMDEIGLKIPEAQVKLHRPTFEDDPDPKPVALEDAQVDAVHRHSHAIKLDLRRKRKV